MNIPLNNQINDINELMILRIMETQTQKIIKKALFIVISIVYPLIEIIFMIFQTKNAFEEDDPDYYEYKDEIDYVSFYNIALGLFSFGSLLCTWGMVSTCYLEINCLRTVLVIKIICIIITFLILAPLNNFINYLVYGTLIFGSFFTLIIVYKVFPKGII